MRDLLKGTVIFAALVTAAPAFAQWHGYRHDPGAFAGAVAGGIVGGILGGGYDYGYGPGYYDYGPGYYGPGPAYNAPVYEGRSVAIAPDSGGDVAYCEQRFRSYDPSSGTYLGYDGMRHPCP